jgi:hypothetical protein
MNVSLWRLDSMPVAPRIVDKGTGAARSGSLSGQAAKKEAPELR